MSDELRSEFHKLVYNSTGRRDELGQSPAAHAIDRLVKRAAQCNALKYDEAAWFTCVHSRLLALALEIDVWDDTTDWVPWCVPQTQSARFFFTPVS
jgi:hypothetical protein